MLIPFNLHEPKVERYGHMYSECSTDTVSVPDETAGGEMSYISDE